MIWRVGGDQGVLMDWEEISHMRAYFPSLELRPIPKNPDNPLVLVPVENTPFNRFDCLNKGEMHLS